MELSVSDGAGRDQPVRVKLHFEDASILSAQQIHEGLRDSWLLVGAHLQSIAELASHIERAFGLRSACPHGISLRMERFTLPPCQPVGLLKDKDVVSIHRRDYLGSASDRQDGHAHSSSLDTFEKIALLCDKDKAGEETKERREDVNKIFVTDGDNETLKLATLNSQEQQLTVEKNQRKSKRISTTPSPEILRNDEYKEDLENCKAKSREKKRKLERKERHSDKKDKRKMVKDREDAGENLHDTKRRRKCPLTTAVPDSDCGKRAMFKEQKKPSTISKKEEHAMKESAANQQMQWSKKNNSDQVSQLDEECKHKEKSPQQSMDHEIVKKCSRSTLRKKAKRRWKHANLELQKNATIIERDKPVKGEISHTEQEFAIAANKQEEDGDAEEERLPRLVRPGHVRFQDSDEDNSADVDPLQSSLPDFGWSHGMSKRKGQSWGKEKTKRVNEKSEAMVEMEQDDIQELNPETLPVIEGTPQNGSVIAYRILRLTPSCCPELSEYCVGRVMDVHSPSGQLKLACVPKYRIWRNNEQDPPDDEDGVIETEISSLAEVRLVESSQLEPGVHDSIEPLENEIERNVCIGADVKVDISEKCNNESSLEKAEPQVETRNSAPYEGWLEITDAIQRKRDELERQTEAKGVRIPEQGSGQADEYEHQAESKSLRGATSSRNEEIRNGVEIENNDQNASATMATNAEVKTLAIGINGFAAGKSLDDKSSFRIRRWHKRAGGLGSTMAFLRSQNTLL